MCPGNDDGFIIIPHRTSGPEKLPNSAFKDFVTDRYRTLKDTDDRIFATSVTANWNYTNTNIDFTTTHDKIRTAMLDVFATNMSYAVQQTMFEMGKAALDACPQISKIDLTCPNKHRIPFNLQLFTLKTTKSSSGPTNPMATLLLLSHDGKWLEKLTTHVLDTTTGKPAAGMRIELHRLENQTKIPLADTKTNQDGRLDAPLLANEKSQLEIMPPLPCRRRFPRRRRSSPDANDALDVVPILFISPTPDQIITSPPGPIPHTAEASMADFDLIIRNGKVVHDNTVIAASIGIANGKILAVDQDLPGAARSEIDATDLHIFPGLTTPRPTNDPGRADWEGIPTGSAAPPPAGDTFLRHALNSSPPVLDTESFDKNRRRQQGKRFADVLQQP